MSCKPSAHLQISNHEIEDTWHLRRCRASLHRHLLALDSRVGALHGPGHSVAAVKNAVLNAMWLLVPSIAATGGSGFALAKGRSGRLVSAKGKRMKIVAANGLLVLLPSAFVLASWADAGRFDGLFYALQGLELLAGAVNFSLLLLNMRDGLKLSGRLKPERPEPSASR